MENQGKIVKELVLALGEVSGHSHTFVGKAKVYKQNEKETVWEVLESGILKHEEHGTISFNKGEFVITSIQMEEDPFTNIMDHIRD